MFWNHYGETYFLNFPFDDLSELDKHWEMWQNTHQNNERITNLHVVLGVEAEYHGLGDFIVPFVANMPIVLVSDQIIGFGELLVGRNLLITFKSRQANFLTFFRLFFVCFSKSFPNFD